MFIIILSHKFPIFKYIYFCSIMLFYELAQRMTTKCLSTEKKLKCRVSGLPHQHNKLLEVSIYYFLGTCQPGQERNLVCKDVV